MLNFCDFIQAGSITLILLGSEKYHPEKYHSRETGDKQRESKKKMKNNMLVTSAQWNASKTSFVEMYLENEWNEMKWNETNRTKEFSAKSHQSLRYGWTKQKRNGIN